MSMEQSGQAWGTAVLIPSLCAVKRLIIVNAGGVVLGLRWE